MTSAGSHTYVVDAQGRRVQRTHDSVTTDYFYLGATVIAEKTGSVWTDYIFFGGQRIAQNTGTSLSTTKFLHPDHLGSTRVCTDSDGSSVGSCDYEPFGEFRGTCSVPTAFRFAGMQWDEDTGLYHTWFREYDATQGRWTGVDPLAGSSDDPQTFNRYVYVSNDPVNFVDPAGTCALWFGFHVIHALVDLATGETISYQVVGFIPISCLVESAGPGGSDVTDNQPPLPPAQTDCHKFADIVQAIANRATSRRDFLDQIASTFTAANDSSVGEMLRTQNMAPRNNFGDSGFKPEFQDGGNQVRHFVAGLIAGANIGAVPALLGMNRREQRGIDDADIALNWRSTSMGGATIGQPLSLIRKWLPRMIREEVCDRPKG